MRAQPRLRLIPDDRPRALVWHQFIRGGGGGGLEDCYLEAYTSPTTGPRPGPQSSEHRIRPRYPYPIAVRERQRNGTRGARTPTAPLPNQPKRSDAEAHQPITRVDRSTPHETPTNQLATSTKRPRGYTSPASIACDSSHRSGSFHIHTTGASWPAQTGCDALPRCSPRRSEPLLSIHIPRHAAAGIPHSSPEHDRPPTHE